MNSPQRRWQQSPHAFWDRCRHTERKPKRECIISLLTFGSFEAERRGRLDLWTRAVEKEGAEEETIQL